MAKINLLPWREQLREERKQQFLVALGGVFILGALLVLAGDRYLNTQIENQIARNNFIQQEISALDGRIREIAELKEKRGQLLERMKIIQDLQGNRPIIAHVFDEIVRTIPDGVYLTALKMVGKEITISGVAESNNRVSTLMRNLDASDWLALPLLSGVKTATESLLDQANDFNLSVLQTQPGEVAIRSEKAKPGKPGKPGKPAAPPAPAKGGK